MKPEIRAIVEKYARRRPNGHVILCTPPKPKPHRPFDRQPILNGNRPKIIYDSEEIAEAARREFAKVGDGRPQVAYPCERSKHGHWHLASAQDKKGNVAGWPPTREEA